MTETEQYKLIYDQVMESIIEVGNRMIDEDDSVDMREVASGMLAGRYSSGCFPTSPVMIRSVKPAQRSVPPVFGWIH